MLFRVALIVGIIVFVIGRQLVGEPLRGKRVIVLPIILTILGAADLTHGAPHLRPVDVVFLVISGALAIAFGLAQGAALRLESRDGYLWGQLPVKGLLLWLGLIASRVALTGVAFVLHAHVATLGASILFMLGLNRLGQAGAVVLRAMGSGIPFAPEKDGKSFLADVINPAPQPTSEAAGRR